MEDFDLELKQSFLEEATQGLDESEKAFLALEQEKDNPEILDELFRLAHNLKGTSMAVGFDEVGDFTHKMEDLILKVKEGSLAPTDEVIGILLECNDHIRHMIETLREDLEATFDSAELISKMLNAGNAEPAPSAPAAVERVETPAVVEPVTAPEPAPIESKEEAPAPEADDPNADQSDKYPSIEELLAKADAEDKAKAEAEGKVAEPEAPVEAKAEPAEPAPVVEAKKEEKTPAPAKAAPPKKAQVDESIRVSLSRLEKLNNYVGELVILQNVLSQNRTDPNSQMMVKSISQLSKLSKEIHEISMSLRMLPMKPTLMKLQRVVRDTSRAVDKKVNLKLVGEDTEVDKTVLEHINDPLIHIVRNAIDHGLETKEKRQEVGKSEAGDVQIKCFHQGNNLIIEVSDDGGGIPPEVIRNKAIEKGILSEDQVLPDEELIQLIFHPGFSTKEQVSEVSGRGVGMDVVKTNIKLLNGDVSVSSTLGKGSVFRISLPLTMAIIDGMIAEVGGQKFVLPLSQVHETIILTDDKTDYITGTGEFLNLRGETLPLYRMGHLLYGDSKQSERIAIIVNVAGDFFAITVDDILTQQQVVVKSLGEEVKDSEAFMGSSILGDGMPALIVDLQAIVRTTNFKALARKCKEKNEKAKAEKKEKDTEIAA